MLLADQRMAEILQRILRTHHHHIGNRAQHDPGDVVLARLVVLQCKIEHRFRFRIHIAGEIESREINARRLALAGGQCRRPVNQFGLAGDEISLTIETPELRIERDTA